MDMERELKVLYKDLANKKEILLKRKSKHPKGKIYSVSRGNYMEYYKYDPVKKRKQYVSKNKAENSIGALIQKRYDTDVLSYIEKCIKPLEQLLEVYEEHKLDSYFDKIPKGNKKYVLPISETLQEKIEKWMSIEYSGKPFMNDENIIITEAGERVRSKSEKILGDKLHYLNVPYKYELPLKLNSFGIIYPDFTVMNVRTGAVFYWEHFGMMDDPEYSQKAVRKIEEYMRNGIFPGEKLLMTFETKNRGIDMEIVKDIIETYLI